MKRNFGLRQRIEPEEAIGGVSYLVFASLLLVIWVLLVNS